MSDQLFTHSQIQQSGIQFCPYQLGTAILTKASFLILERNGKDNIESGDCILVENGKKMPCILALQETVLDQHVFEHQLSVTSLLSLKDAQLNTPLRSHASKFHRNSLHDLYVQ